MLSLRTILEVIVILAFLEQKVKAAVSCPSGDTAGVVKDGQTCSALITADNAECYNTTTESACCASCNSVNTGISGCSYGDSASCFSFLCASYTSDGLLNCCETCYTGTTGAPTGAPPGAPTTTASVPTTSSSSSGSTVGYEGGSSNKDNGGIIVGAVVGSLVSAGLLAMGAFLLARWYNKKKKIDDESTQNLPEKVDSDNKAADINNDLPIKANGNHLFIAQTVPPSATGVPNNQNLNNNTHKDETILDTEQTNNKRNEENKVSNKEDKTSNETNNDTDIRRQSLPPLPGVKPGSKPNNHPLPPIAD